MKLEEVLPAFREGKGIKRSSWGMECKGLQSNMGIVFSFEDINAIDWEIIEPPKKKKKIWLRAYLTPAGILYLVQEGLSLFKKYNAGDKRIHALDREVEIEE